MIDESELPELIQKPELIHLFNARAIVHTLALLYQMKRAARIVVDTERQRHCNDSAELAVLDTYLAALDDGKEAG